MRDRPSKDIHMLRWCEKTFGGGKLGERGRTCSEDNTYRPSDDAPSIPEIRSVYAIGEEAVSTTYHEFG